MKKKMMEQIEWEIGDSVKIDNTELDDVAGMTGTIIAIGYIDNSYRALLSVANGAYITVDPRRFIEHKLTSGES